MWGCSLPALPKKADARCLTAPRLQRRPSVLDEHSRALLEVVEVAGDFGG
jgi:hypothetical protein